MMKKVLIIPNSSSGHTIPTFQIAKVLLENGYAVTYLVDSNMKDLIQKQGFEVVICHTEIFGDFESWATIPHQHYKRFLERIIERISNRFLNNTIKNLLKFEEAIEKIAPDLILLDVFFGYAYILLKNKRPTIFIQTMLSTYYDALTPPISSTLLPNNKFLMKLDWIKCKFKWRKPYFVFWGDSMWGVTKRALKKLNRPFDFSILDRNKSYHVGIKNIPEWVLSPKEFDFPKDKSLPFQKHIGPTTNLDRAEIYDAHYNNWVEKTKGQKIVYCSLGTVSLLHNRKSVEFLKKVVTVFSTKRDWQLIMSCGEVDVNELGVVSPNIHLFKKVPQLDVIKRSDFVITHGGLNTVTECILLATPMIVFPLNDTWDQNGNAARVVYHKLGLRGNIKTITVAELHQQIDIMIESSIFKEHIFKMGLIFKQRNKTLNATIQTIFNSEEVVMTS
jgi:zeaxanthin glucosyltransferase